MAGKSQPVTPFVLRSTSEQLYRTNSVPSNINTIDGALPLRFNASRAQKKAQTRRTSVAVTNSDYYNQWRPQMSPLVKARGSGANIKPAPSAPSLDTISEYDIELLDRRPGPEPADPNMFRYTPTPILDPSRQSIPSRPTTPQIGSGGFAPIHSMSIMSPPSSATATNINFLRGSSQAIHVTAAANNQFLPLFLNPETGNVYMFENGYYIPIPSKSVEQLERGTTAGGLTKAPTPDRRSVTLPTPPPDCFKFVVAITFLSCFCLNIPVLLLCLIPSLLCSYRVRIQNTRGNIRQARTCYEWTLCSSISGIIFIVLTVLAIPVTLLVLRFAVNVIP